MSGKPSIPLVQLGLLYDSGIWTAHRCRHFLDRIRRHHTEYCTSGGQEIKIEENAHAVARACRKVLRSAANQRALADYVRRAQQVREKKAARDGMAVTTGRMPSAMI